MENAITGFLSKSGKKWSRTAKPVVMKEDGQSYIIALLTDVIDIKGKCVDQPKPKYIKGSPTALKKVAIGFKVKVS